MNTMPEVKHDNVNILAAYGFGLARIAATAIREEVIDCLTPTSKRIAQRLLAHLDDQSIYEPSAQADLIELVDIIAEQIDEETELVTHYDHDPCNVSNIKNWTQNKLSEEADGLTNALVILVELLVSVNVIRDLLQAEAMLARKRSTH